MGYCEATLGAASPQEELVLLTQPRCLEAYNQAYQAVLRLFPHNFGEEQEPIASRNRAQALQAVLDAEAICPDLPTFGGQPNRFPPLAPERPLLAPSSREPAGTASNPPAQSREKPQILNGEAGKHFNQPGDALKSWANVVWPSSKKWNTELAGKLYQNTDGTWSYTPSYPGDEGSSNPNVADPYVWSHGNPFKSYEIHTHGDYRISVTSKDGTTSIKEMDSNQRKSVDQFSMHDKARSSRSNQPQFMLTPGGDLMEWIPDPIGRMGFGLVGKEGTQVKIGNLNGSAWNNLTGL
jgi:hypothetical protein